MRLNPNWRILTIGDGDLSFSWSLLKHHKPQTLVATVYDDQQTLCNKYGEEYYRSLLDANCQVLTEFDVTKPETWTGLSAQRFDLVIFQFPLIPGFESKQAFLAWQGYSVNTANRYLLNRFLFHSFKHFLAADGARLAYISSKDVKPYNEWDIERALHQQSGASYLGKMPFDVDAFPEYRIRNVDRDKWVKDTSGVTYVWSDKQPQSLTSELIPTKQITGACCDICLAGPFATEQESVGHFASKRHQLLTDYHRQWAEYQSKHQLD